jgi:hypothetical protein
VFAFQQFHCAIRLSAYGTTGPSVMCVVRSLSGETGQARWPSSLSDWGFDLREAPSVLSQIVG